MRITYTSIKDITPKTRDWKIKMLVVEKSPKRIGQHSSVKYQNLMLVDEQGNRLQATIFGNDINSREDSLQMFRSYYIINAYVKLLDPKYQTESHQYQWIINAKTIIEEIPENEQQVKIPKYNLIPINELDAYKDSIAEIDLLAVALHIKPPKEITLTNGPATLQEIYVIDQSFNPISLTMWGRFVQDECKKISEIIETKPILLATKLKVRSYNGLSLSSRPASAFTINPLIPEAKPLQRCCRAYVEVDDGTGKLAAVMFGELAEKALGHSAIDFMNQTGEEHLPFIQKMASEASENQWMIQLAVDPEIFNQQKHKNFNVISIDPVQYGPELE
ncbi:replication protein A 70 kDa DNA-binding subunit D-like [Carya illinoinensis]|uniref:replication protein A 70 kDa DNA-binding subunit D-like n=1 Tax=Carya illinoinensis TaxID=32201 RepID=UPI001C722CA7|nr:replication protein A 70 kDa DNA-binding subunit D-like [Carya illinoinensis]